MLSNIRPYKDPLLTGSVSSILASFYRKILSDLGIEENTFNRILDKYINRLASAGIIKDPSSKRGNLHTELMQDTMTWSVFLNGLKVLGVNEFTIKFILRNDDGLSKEVETTTELNIKESKEDRDSPERLLAKIFRILENPINHEQFAELMDIYIKRVIGPCNIAEMVSRKGNFKKELFRDKLSWNVFVKGLVLLGVTNFTMQIYLKQANKSVTIHDRSVQL